MTVKELIEILSRADERAQVLISDTAGEERIASVQANGAIVLRSRWAIKDGVEL